LKNVDELLRDREELQQYLEWGKDILVFNELNTVKEKIKGIDDQITTLIKIN
jgi:hypothetical protein